MIDIIIKLMLLAATGVNFTGKVLNEANEPIEGAIVVISTAKPKAGPSMMCPSCYPDCAKRAITNANGEFTFEELDDQLLFRLSVGASGYQGTNTQHLDPSSAEPTQITIKPLPTGTQYARIEGTVLGSDGKPLAGCEVSTQTESRGPVTTSRVRSVTPVSITNELGRFEMVAEPDIDAAEFRFIAPGYAEAELDWVRSNPRELNLTMKRGASVTGRLVFAGKPVSRALIGIVQENRTVPNVVTPMEVATNDDGFFRFDNLPPELDYVLSTHGNQAITGVLPTSLVKLPADNQLVDLGDIETAPPQKLTIKVQMEDGSDIPNDCVIFLGRNKAWYGQQLKIAPGKIFELTLEGMAAEAYKLSTLLKNCEVAETVPPTTLDINRSRDVYVSSEKDNSITITLKQSTTEKQP